MQFLHVAAAHHHSGLKCRLPALVEKANYKNALPSNKSWSFLTHVLRHKWGRYKVLIILPFFLINSWPACTLTLKTMLPTSTSTLQMCCCIMSKNPVCLFWIKAEWWMLQLVTLVFPLAVTHWCRRPAAGPISQSWEMQTSLSSLQRSATSALPCLKTQRAAWWVLEPHITSWALKIRCINNCMKWK